MFRRPDDSSRSSAGSAATPSPQPAPRWLIALGIIAAISAIILLISAGTGAMTPVEDKPVSTLAISLLPASTALLPPPAVTLEINPTSVPATVTKASLVTVTPSAALGPTASNTPTSAATEAASPTSGPAAPIAAPPIPTSVPAVAHPYVAPQIIANYLPWYDTNSWNNNCTSDSPQAGPYNSDDSATIVRHIGEAQRAGLDGFAVHWGGSGDRTDRNFVQVLALGGGAFRSTVTFLGHFFYGAASQSSVVGQLQYLIGSYSGNSGFLQMNGKPVILFADMERIATQGGQTPQQAWAAVRAQADPAHDTLWIAEGLDPTYLETFDGLYVYRIDYACCEGAYWSASRWAGWTRQYEASTGQPRYFVGTIQPGWNDLNSANPGCYGNRLATDTFARDRANGAYYQDTFSAALGASPDLMVVHSFNEWVEGSHIEPSVNFGDFYLNLTAQLAAAYKSSR